MMNIINCFHPRLADFLKKFDYFYPYIHHCNIYSVSQTSDSYMYEIIELTNRVKLRQDSFTNKDTYDPLTHQILLSMTLYQGYSADLINYLSFSYEITSVVVQREWVCLTLAYVEFSKDISIHMTRTSICFIWSAIYESVVTSKKRNMCMSVYKCRLNKQQACISMHFLTCFFFLLKDFPSFLLTLSLFSIVKSIKKRWPRVLLTPLHLVCACIWLRQKENDWDWQGNSSWRKRIEEKTVRL